MTLAYFLHYGGFAGFQERTALLRIALAFVSGFGCFIRLYNIVLFEKSALEHNRNKTVKEQSLSCPDPRTPT